MRNPMRPSRNDPSTRPMRVRPALGVEGNRRQRIGAGDDARRHGVAVVQAERRAGHRRRRASMPPRGIRRRPTCSTRAAAGTVRSDSLVAWPDLRSGMATLRRNRKTPETARMVPTPPTEMQAAAMRSAALTVQRVPCFRVRGRCVIEWRCRWAAIRAAHRTKITRTVVRPLQRLLTLRPSLPSSSPAILAFTGKYPSLITLDCPSLLKTNVSELAPQRIELGARLVVDVNEEEARQRVLAGVGKIRRRRHRPAEVASALMGTARTSAVL